LVQFPKSKNPMQRDLYKENDLVPVLIRSWDNKYL